MRGIFAFTLLYPVLFFVGTFGPLPDVLRVGGAATTYELMSTAAATLGNVGPGFGVVGPMGSYRSFSPLGKPVMVVLMWLGRLEILPVLARLTPKYWRR